MSSCTTNPIIKALGETLVTKNGEVKTADLVKGKSVIGLYFSAHWCPPCRGFTPTLSSKYTALKEAEKDFELIFISGDRDQKSFDDYHKTMSFPAMSFDNDDGNETLNELCEVQGIPALVFVDGATGALITKEGREEIEKENFIEKFPYTPKPFNFLESLGDTLVTKSGKISTKEALQGKSVLGLYFSAHWCPPCRGFTPTLGKKYEELKKAGKDFELIFVSSDKDQKSFDDYHNEMPFLAMPFANRDGKNELSTAMGVSGIPSLCFVDATTGKLITDDGRSAITAPTFVEDFPYHPKLVNDLGVTCSGINDKTSLILFMEDSSEDDQKAMTASLTEIAEAEQKKPENEQAVERFFTATGEGPVNQLRGACKLALKFGHKHELKEDTSGSTNWGCDGCGKGGGSVEGRFRCSDGCDFDYCGECNKKAKEKQEDREPSIIILQLSANGNYYKSSSTVTASSIRSFIQDFTDKKLTASIWNE